MRLADWMKAEKLDDDAVVERLRRAGCSANRSSVNRYRRGLRRPDWDVIAGFKKISKGKVTADDFQVLEAAE